MIEGLKRLLNLGKKDQVMKDLEKGERKEEAWPTEVQIFDYGEIMRKRMWGLNMELHGNWPKIWFYTWGYEPERGDLILIPMKSGKKVVARITQVEWQENVDDMAKINVELLGYKNDNVDMSQYKQKKLRIRGLIQL